MARPGKEDAGNTLANSLARKIFRQQVQAVLDRSESLQSKFAETISGVTGMGLRPDKGISIKVAEFCGTIKAVMRHVMKHKKSDPKAAFDRKAGCHFLLRFAFFAGSSGASSFSAAG